MKLTAEHDMKDAEASGDLKASAKAKAMRMFAKIAFKFVLRKIWDGWAQIQKIQYLRLW